VFTAEDRAVLVLNVQKIALHWLCLLFYILLFLLKHKIGESLLVCCCFMELESWHNGAGVTSFPIGVGDGEVGLY